ncbi:MAG: hypothetical protein Q9213_006238 [Squamulea squamosa]
MAEVFHSSDGYAWRLPVFTAQELEIKNFNDLIVSVITANIPPNSWTEYTKYSHSNLVEVFAYLLSSAGPDEPTEAELEHMKACLQKWKQNMRNRSIYVNLRQCNEITEERRMQDLHDGLKTLDIPEWDTFCNSVRNAARPALVDDRPSPTTMALTAEAAAIEQLEILGNLMRDHIPDTQIADRTMLVSLHDRTWISDKDNWTTHLHLSRTLGFRALNPRIFKVGFFRGEDDRFNVRRYQRNENENIIWSMIVSETDFYGLQSTTLALLPHGTYIPSYGLTEIDTESPRSSKFQTKGSPSWLAQILPPAAEGKEWYLENANRELCLACRQSHSHVAAGATDTADISRATRVSRVRCRTGSFTDREKVTFVGGHRTHTYLRSKPICPPQTSTSRQMGPRRSLRVAASPQPLRRSYRVGKKTAK